MPWREEDVERGVPKRLVRRPHQTLQRRAQRLELLGVLSGEFQRVFPERLGGMARRCVRALEEPTDLRRQHTFLVEFCKGCRLLLRKAQHSTHASLQRRAGRTKTPLLNFHMHCHLVEAMLLDGHVGCAVPLVPAHAHHTVRHPPLQPELAAVLRTALHVGTLLCEPQPGREFARQLDRGAVCPPCCGLRAAGRMLRLRRHS